MTRGRTQDVQRSTHSVRVADWLARAHADPDAAHREWAERGVAMLPLGVRFDAVRIPFSVVRAALGTDNRDAIGRTLPQMLGGPVIQDGEKWTYPLVPTGGASAWSARAGNYRGRGWLAVPDTDQLGPPGMYWTVAMAAPGRLCEPAAVASMIEAGVSALSGKEGR
ncbi:hypothetical protein ACIP93_01035 [Streptomyces sp. NPDC088745]|uniref:hypothetical protein n=1 Tax=Streptomyces sp. NPDC088745 TaxID=3365884 RepID=UPI0037F62BE8